MIVELLGTGTSQGVPMVGCSCGVCRSGDPRDQRLRSSLYVQGAAGERIVIDTGPEFRLQAIRAGIDRLDAVLLTHAHADHVHGLDDVRPLNRHGEIPVFGNAETVAEVGERFSYIFRTTQAGGGKPQIRLTVAADPFRIGRLTITPLPVRHGDLAILGWLVAEGDARVAYITDASAIPETSRALIRNVAVLVLGALRNRPHPTHLSFDQARRVAAESGAERVYLTHLCHEHSHREMLDLLESERSKVAPAWDGLRLEVPAAPL
jgi:phosphoribosyl 1,2-cyclic phosphate phosphodiesterase